MDAPASAGVASDVMRRSPRTCSPQSTVIEAVLIFKDEDCGLVPIVDGGKPVGVVTDRDVALGLANVPDLEARAVSEIMSTKPIVIPPDMPLVDVAGVFAMEGVRRLLVVDGDGMLIGVISWSDVAKRLSFSVMGAIVNENTSQPSNDKS